MKKMNKILLVTIIALTLLFTLSTIIEAVYTPNSFKGRIDTTGTGTGNIKATGGKIVGIIRIVGTIIAVAMITILGIKYMMGSAEERAEYKKTLFPYFVGAVLLFGASNLTQVIYTWASAL